MSNFPVFPYLNCTSQFKKGLKNDNAELQDSGLDDSVSSKPPTDHVRFSCARIISNSTLLNVTTGNRPLSHCSYEGD